MWTNTLRLAALACGLMAGTPTLAAENDYEVAFYEAGLLNDGGTGIDRDVVTEIQRRSGLSLWFSEKPRARIWSELKSGSLAITVSGIRTAERDQFAWFLPYLSQRNMAILLKPRAARYRSLDEFVADRTAVVGVVRGFVHGERYDAALSVLRKQGRVYEAASVDTLFKLLKLGNRIDLIFALPVFYQKQLADLAMHDLVQVSDWDTDGAPIEHGLVLSKERVAASDVESLRKALADMKADGTLNAIIARHFSSAEKAAAPGF